MKKYDYLLFDADNTLFDFTKAEYNAFKVTAEYGSLDYSEELYSRYSAINDELWKRLEKKEITLDFLKTERFYQLLLSCGYDSGDGTLAKAAELRDKYMTSLASEACLIDGASEVCHNLKKSHKMYLITNGISMIQRSRLAKSALADVFDGVFISEEMGVAKPSVAYFEKVLASIGDGDRRKYLVIGDSLTSDCDGAIAYGLDVCRYNPEEKPSDGRELTYNVKKLTELYDILGVNMTASYEKLRSLITEYNNSGKGQITVRENEPMSAHTSFRIGGTADLFLIPQDEESLVSLAGMIKLTDTRAFFLGNGTNLLFSDEGYRGAVVSFAELRGIKVDGNRITAGAGASLTTVCKTARDSSLTGMETAYGIPGSVGGAVYMNAGAYGGQIADVLETSRFLDTDTLEIGEITLDEHRFGYRESIYKHTNRIVLSATFSLSYGDKDEIGARMNEIMQRRVDKQPLEYPSAGSVFKRPEGHFAGQLIEESGLKGLTVGGAQVSEKHAGFIINKGGATEKDVRGLIEKIIETIEKNYGFRLETEVISVGP